MPRLVSYKRAYMRVSGFQVVFSVVFILYLYLKNISASKVNILQKAIRIPPVWAWGEMPAMTWPLYKRHTITIPATENYAQGDYQSDSGFIAID